MPHLFVSQKTNQRVEKGLPRVWMRQPTFPFRNNLLKVTRFPQFVTLLRRAYGKMLP
jgi:hypothetical protein